MNRSRAVFIAIMLVSLIAGPLGLGALEAESGRVRLLLHEGAGRYSLYVLSTEEPQEYIPLFVDRDPRTSGLSVVVNGRVFRIGEGAEFRQTAEHTAAGARFLWESRSLRITQEFVFVSVPLAAGTPVAAADTGRPGTLTANAVRIELTLTNLSPAPLAVGVRDCLDTYLGESQSAHFRTDPGGDVEAESTIPGDRMIRSWSSESKSVGGVALRRITSGGGVTPPDRVVFANWKRLSQAPWSYDTTMGRSFTLLPYSINDSAVCHYYDPLPIAPGSSRRIVSILAGHSAALDTPSPETPGVVAVPPAPRAATDPVWPSDPQPGVGAAGREPTRELPPTDPRAGMSDAVDSLNELLLRIEAKLSSGQPVTDEDIQLIEEALSGIKSRSEPYLRNP